MICLALTAPDFEENRKALVTYRPWIDLVEMRVDRLRHDQLPLVADFMSKAFEEFGLSFVLTIRLIEDGGAWAHGEVERRSTFVAILQNLAVGVLSWVD